MPIKEYHMLTMYAEKRNVPIAYSFNAIENIHRFTIGKLLNSSIVEFTDEKMINDTESILETLKGIIDNLVDERNSKHGNGRTSMAHSS